MSDQLTLVTPGHGNGPTRTPEKQRIPPGQLRRRRWQPAEELAEEQGPEEVASGSTDKGRTSPRELRSGHPEAHLTLSLRTLSQTAEADETW